MTLVQQQFEVGGMHCGSCAAGIEVFLSSTDGIKNVTVDYDAGKASVEYDKEQTSSEKIVEDIGMLGYTVKPSTESPRHDANSHEQ